MYYSTNLIKTNNIECIKLFGYHKIMPNYH